MSDVVVPFSGWGRGTWSQLAFGEASITNDGAAGQVGSVTVVAEANVPVTGLEATASVGSVTVVAEANVFPTGLEATGEVGAIANVIGEANVYPTGVEGTGAVGTATVRLWCWILARTRRQQRVTLQSYSQQRTHLTPSFVSRKV